MRVVPTFLGAHGCPRAHPGDYVERLETEMIPAVAAAELARFCDVFCEDFVFNAAESTRISKRAASRPRPDGPRR